MKYILPTLLCALSLNAMAQDTTPEQPQQEERRWDLTLGMAAASFPKIKGADDSNVLVLPYVDVRYYLDEYNEIFANPISGIGYRHAFDEKLSAGVKVNYVGDRESDDSTLLAGMADVDASAEVGPFVRYKFNRKLSTEVALAADAGDAHNGWTLQPSLNYMDRVAPQWLAGASISAVYGDDNYSQTYFSVNAADATASRAAYTAEAGIHEWSVGLNLTHLIDENWFVRGDLMSNFYVGDAEDSPIMEEDQTYSSILSFGYKF